MKDLRTIKIHIKKVEVGDTILINDVPHTICKKDIRHCPFMGTSIKGDTYNLGRILIDKVIF